ncbi:Uncharacterized protein BP5553_03737 [Venustampulla echinocandica]|uniref:Uncharacterized protein n=1 Tax=Venustampulla echinocandica TaxID=2656787 RepID=A0A370TV34_9HELO|nr:Uncharacterized protein BP5553_03737 [Venustampulla echinocandica]RDL39397.1 Uncharacterized protein BP5553_03737 [Venustampulla echinocandica]
MASPKAEPPDDESQLPTQARREFGASNTPRRGPASKRNATNTPNAPTTPIGRTSALNNKRIPTSAPARTKPGTRKAEPTLLGDFLLGRPSPARTRRKSLDVVKAEMREDVVGKVQAPGGVKDRVKQWQKTSAAAVVADPLADAASQPDDIGGWENEDDESVDERERQRIKFRAARRPSGRRKSKDGVESVPKQNAVAPKKRVISDSHWMKNKKKSPLGKGTAIPKDFLKTTAINPPLEKKIEDWVKRTEGEEPVTQKPKDKPRNRNTPRKYTMDDGIRVAPSSTTSREDGIRVTPSKHHEESQPNSYEDDGIRITPSNGLAKEGSRNEGAKDGSIRLTPSKQDSQDDSIRITPSKESLVEDGVRARPVRKDTNKRRPNQSGLEDALSRKSRGKNLNAGSGSKSKRMANSQTAVEHGEEDEDKFSWMTPSPPENSKRRNRNSRTPPESLADIPFGNSAFSVLELPLGAEAGTMKRPPPKRNPSFAGVPKALKKVFNEGMKIAHDTVEPPRGGINQPPSIESWLNNTSDPFVDHSSSPAPSSLDVPESGCSRKPSFKQDDPSEKALTADHNSEQNDERRNPRSRSIHEPEAGTPEKASPVGNPKTRQHLPSMVKSQPMAPTGLKRSPAARNTSSPKAKKLPLKDAFIDAFRGESTTSRPRSGSNPFVDITGLRERDVNSDLPHASDVKPSHDSRDTSQDTPSKRSPRAHQKKDVEDHRLEKPLAPPERRSAPMTGMHRLSTILSVETLSTSSSKTESASELSQTTVTQDTVYTGTTMSSLSRSSQRSNKQGLKRRLTKHSDLVSMLSLPDAVEPGRAKSIKSARSIRTTRTHLDTATVQDLMRELAEDEVKYMRELKTLVDGVIPVLLTCLLSKSDSAIAAGLLDPNHDISDAASFTKPIVDMGVALERLKSLHKRIPLTDADAFITWAHTAHKTYEDYLATWRAGFNDVVVNLAPASPSASAQEQLDLDDIPRNMDGDALGSNGERADVAYFLKRPLVRVKYLSRTTKGLSKLMDSDMARKVEEKYRKLTQVARRRHKEEQARLENEKANNTDTTRARDPRTLDLVEGINIDRSRQVCAKDLFSLDLQHSSGQRLGCRVELILRDKPNDTGDLLICEADEAARFLLFPPISQDLVSARLGETTDQVVVMIRGIRGVDEWDELLLLEAEFPEAAKEWIEMLGTEPAPPEVRKDATYIDPLDLLVSTITGTKEPKSYYMSGALDLQDPQIPIGESIRREAEQIESSPIQDRQRVSRRQAGTSNSMPESIKEESIISEDIKDLNDAMNKAGSPTTLPQRQRAARYHGRVNNSRPTTPQSDPVDSDSEQTTPTQARHAGNNTNDLDFSPMDELSIPKRRTPSTTPTRDDGAPPPPAHRTPTTPSTLKKAPILDTPTPRANNRRTSSPLKHEYQLSNASGTSSAEEDSDSQDSDTYTESSSEEELEAADVPGPLPIYGRRVSPSGSIYSLPNTTLAPSNSASQAPYRQAPLECSAKDTDKHTVMSISYWNDKGKWIDIQSSPCSVVVGPGWVRAFNLDESPPTISPGATPPSSTSDGTEDDSRVAPRPLVAQELTPNVPMQRHMIDIHVRSPLMTESTLKCKGIMIRYHVLTPIDCIRLYQALYESSKNNMVYNKLEEERRVNAFGSQPLATKNRRGSWFGRRNSYRASARAPSEMASEQSGKSSSSRLSALKQRWRGGNAFNIAKSSVNVAQRGNGDGSGSTSLYSSDAGLTPPRTPISGSLFSGTTTSQMIDLGSENIKIRLYELATQSRWEDYHCAFLTVTPPPPGRRQVSTLHHGLEKHVIVTRRPHNHPDGPGQILVDEVLGAGCFKMLGVKGVLCTIWLDIRGPNGEVGMIGARGGVSGRQRKVLFQTNHVAHANWIFNLLAAGH